MFKFKTILDFFTRKELVETEEPPPRCTCKVYNDNWYGQVIVFSTDCPYHSEYALEAMKYNVKEPWTGDESYE